ncbi:hypothetical protein Vi05172_g228 [Venturia inaequalis]|nr:hypothetical protein Vi05172_g228 [Venturia inaequalis]
MDAACCPQPSAVTAHAVHRHGPLASSLHLILPQSVPLSLPKSEPCLGLFRLEAYAYPHNHSHLNLTFWSSSYDDDISTTTITPTTSGHCLLNRRRRLCNRSVPQEPQETWLSMTPIAPLERSWQFQTKTAMDAPPSISS